jgi:hypothetical protein
MNIKVEHWSNYPREVIMRVKYGRIFIVSIAFCLAFSGCTGAQIATPTSTATLVPSATLKPTASPMPTATPIPLPELTQKPGDFYFSEDGQPTFILSRNPTGKTQADFDAVLDWTHQGGSKVIRIHLTHGWWGDPWINKDWSVNEKWAQDWDRFFDQAQADRIYVIPVFGVWADWNNGLPADVYHFWQYNPLNTANGGPLDTPTGLFQSDSDTQKHWLTWVQTLVERWQGRNNIAAWEIFSEINLASGAPGETDSKGAVSVPAAVDFTNKAATSIRTADTNHRPVTLSLAVGAPFTNEWAKFYELETLDFIEIHPYSDQLDRELIADVRQQLNRYNKPVMIGENGLWSMTYNANAHIGIEHAIWAGLVSGAMNGRAFWDNDGYSIYSISNRADAIAFMQKYATTELPVVNFTQGVDFSGFQPLTSTSSSGVWGAAVGNETMVLGWYRDAASEPPDWKLQPIISNQTVTLTVPGKAANWKIDFYDTKTGTDIVSSSTVTRKSDKVTILLPDFTDDIAFKLYIQK